MERCQICTGDLQAADTDHVALEVIAALIRSDGVVAPHRHGDAHRLTEQLRAGSQILFNAERNSETAFRNQTARSGVVCEGNLIENFFPSTRFYNQRCAQ